MQANFTEITDEALVARVLAHDADAFTALVNRYQSSLFRLARHFVREDAVAEDVVQDTWVGLLRGIERFEGRSAFRTWLFRILANRARTRAVREARYVPLAEDDGPEAGEAFDETGAWRTPPREWRITPERALLSAEVRELVTAAIAALPASQRAVVELRDVQGLEAAEVCNILGLTETNQRVLLHRGRRRVRTALAARLEL